jgi:tetratricopeptide (TPR) repeat protein
MSRALVYLSILASLAAGTALASEQSELLYSRGLIELHANRVDKALEYFDKAVEADPNDPYALYYRGVTRNRAGRYAESVSDLQAAMKLKPDLSEAAFDLGFGLVQTGQYEEATKWLEQAQQTPTLEGEASFFLGIAQLRTKQLDKARANLQRAAQKNPELEPEARYYLGVVEYQDGNTAKAEEHFAAANAASPGTAVGKEAAEFREQTKAGVAPTAAKPFGLWGSAALQYDSNVTIGPSEEDVQAAIGVEPESDGRFAFTLGGQFAPLNTKPARLALGYEFFQSIHFQQDDFNTQDHRPYITLSGDAGPVQWGVHGQYDYYFLKLNSFFQQWMALPWVTVPEGGFGRSEAYYRFRSRDFYDATFKDQGAFNHAFGLRQFFYIGDTPEQNISVGYRYDFEDTFRDTLSSDAYQFDGHAFDAGVGWKLPWEIYTNFDYVFRIRNYDDASGGRDDYEHRILLVGRKPITDMFAVSLGYFGIFNDSDTATGLDEFDYTRNIVSIALEARY